MIPPIWPYHFLCWNKAAFKLEGISHEIDKNVHHSSKVSDDSGGGEEQTVSHDLQVQLDAHEDHKHILPNLKRRKETWQHLPIGAWTGCLMQLLNHLVWIPEVWGRAWSWWRVIQTSWRCNSRWSLWSSPSPNRWPGPEDHCRNTHINIVEQTFFFLEFTQSNFHIQFK